MESQPLGGFSVLKLSTVTVDSIYFSVSNGLPSILCVLGHLTEKGALC